MRDGGADEVREGQGTSGENESSRLNGGGRGGAVAPPAAIPGPVVQWERFLPVRSLKVLLVENDDCTRHVVSALLRNCSYEVTSVANGLQAWKVLVDLKNHVDIVLAEVVMPCLSGFGLLCKIMNHKTRKNIPVIMMSSNDSMGTVFKCLSKGAVDFLVKPIRKNELKNLWQHVWRRCHSSSGSGSESGIHAPKSGKSRGDDDSDNDTGSDNDDRNGSADNIRGGSDNGSGTQSSWTKRAVEADSPQTNFPSDQVAVQHDSTCAQDIHPKLDTSCNEWVHFSNTKVCMEHMESAENDFNERDLEIGLNKNIDLQHKLSANEKVSTYLTGPSVDKLAESDPKRDVHDAVLELHSNNMASRSSNEVADLIGGFPQASDAQVATGVIKARNCFISKSRDKINDKFKVPSLELSLKRLISSEDGGVTGNDEHNVLRHSDLSAFSRYNISAASTQAAAGFGGICSPQVDNNLEAVKIESAHNMISNPDAATVNQGSNGSSANNDKGSTSKNVLIKPEAGKVHLSAFKRLQHETSTQQVMQEKLDNATAGATAVQPVGPQRQVQMQHHHHHYHHHHYHVHRMKQQLQPPPDNDDSSLMHMTVADPQSTSLNPFARPAEEKAANCSLNGSNSGSNHGSNGQNGSSMAPNRGTVNSGNGNDNAENGADHCNKSSNAEETNRFSQREAALNKFRLKRKERNFQKKVRYHSRKRLAEQRPRIRGQFVRQNEYETTSREAGSKSSE